MSERYVLCARSRFLVCKRAKAQTKSRLQTLGACIYLLSISANVEQSCGSLYFVGIDCMWLFSQERHICLIRLMHD